jgi:RNA polymerase sigma factor (TIGR02999 family)
MASTPCPDPEGSPGGGDRGGSYLESSPRPTSTEVLAEQTYKELRRIAVRCMRGQRHDHTLRPTALVHEAFLRLARRGCDWQSRTDFVAVAATAMRRILVDCARRRGAAKRYGGSRVTLVDADAIEAERPIDLLALDEALSRLSILGPRAERVVELRFFAGLEIEEVGPGNGRLSCHGQAGLAVRPGMAEPGAGRGDHAMSGAPDRWHRVRQIFDRAVELEPGERERVVEELAGDDVELGREVLGLLSALDRDGSRLERLRPFEVLDGEVTEPAGIRLGAYRLLREVGEGGMGSVYEAVRDDEQFEKRVAIKLIRRGMASEGLVRRFRQERQILAGLEHPNIARLLDGGTAADDRPYLVMEYVDGEPITKYCEGSQLVVHRDLKPGNISSFLAGMLRAPDPTWPPSSAGLRMVAMIDDALDRLEAMGHTMDRRVFMMGFSASGSFTSRFALIHPDRVKAAAPGSPGGGWPMAPVATWEGVPLRYPKGIMDFEELVGRPFDLETFRGVALYIYVGDADTNPGIDLRGIPADERAQLTALLSLDDPVRANRWPLAQAVYESVGSPAQFVIYPGVAHTITAGMFEDVKAFFRANR